MLKSFLPSNKESIYIAITVGILYAILGVIYIFFIDNVHGLYLLMALGSIFNSACLEAGIMEYHSAHRFAYVNTVNLIGLLPIVLGCVFASNIFLIMSGLILFSIVRAFTGDANKVVNFVTFTWSLLYTFTLSIDVSVEKAFLLGISYVAGGLMISLLTYSFSYFRKALQQISIHEHLFDKSWMAFGRRKTGYAFWLSISTCVSLVIAEKLSLANTVWAPMAVFIILKFDIDASKRAILHRFSGTLCGILVAIPIAYYIQKPELILIIIPIMAFITVFFVTSKVYGTFVFFLTIFVTIGLSCVKEVELISLKARFLDTVTAVVISGVVICIIVPIHRKFINAVLIQTPNLSQRTQSSL